MGSKKKKPHPKVMKTMQRSEKIVEKTNPFDIKINRKKHDIIGQKKTKHGSISKNKLQINQKRKDFLKKTHLYRNKANNFIDRRIGEYDSDMLNEDRVMARISEGQRKRHKKSLYNLNDDFDLTHDGQPIASLETFDDLDNNESDEEDDSQLNADFVNEAHFGGFLTKKDDNAPKTRKEILNEFILDTKKKKQERKEAKELTDDLTTKLDEEWKQIHSWLPDTKNNNTVKNIPCDSFDKIVKELKFEPRGSDVIKTKDEDLENEKKKKKLEEDRISRMNNLNTNKKFQGFSADALDENFELFSEVPETENPEHPVDLESNNSTNINEFTDVSMETNSGSEDEESNASIESDDESNSCLDLKDSQSISSVPQTLKELSDLISNLNIEEMTSKLDSIVSVCQFKPDTENIKNSLKFFNLLLEYIDIKFENGGDRTLLDIKVSCLSSLAQKSSQETGKVVRNYLFKKISLYQKQKNKKNVTFFNILILLKVCGHLYSTSDFHHPISTPAMILLSDMLTSDFHITTANVMHRIFACHIIYEYVLFSKRFVPEVVNYLFSTLILASTKKSALFSQISKINSKISVSKKIFYVSSNIGNWELIDFFQLCFKDGLKKIDKTEEILSVIHHIIVLLKKYSKLYENIPAFSSVFHPATELTSFLPVEYYPIELVEKIKELQTFVSQKENCLQFLTFPNKKPKLLKLFTPRFDDFCDKKSSGMLEKIKVHKQLSKKIKKEEKGVIRELRRDAEFEAREQLNKRLEADFERKQKVKQLYAQLASQENECKHMSKR